MNKKNLKEKFYTISKRMKLNYIGIYNEMNTLLDILSKTTTSDEDTLHKMIMNEKSFLEESEEHLIAKDGIIDHLFKSL